GCLRDRRRDRQRRRRGARDGHLVDRRRRRQDDCPADRRRDRPGRQEDSLLPRAGALAAALADRWLTFDCFGTLIDWRHGIRTTGSSCSPVAAVIFWTPISGWRRRSRRTARSAATGRC